MSSKIQNLLSSSDNPIPSRDYYNEFEIIDNGWFSDSELQYFYDYQLLGAHIRNGIRYFRKSSLNALRRCQISDDRKIYSFDRGGLFNEK